MSETCTELRKVVEANAGARRGEEKLAHQAIEKMGKEGCTEELRKIANEYSTGHGQSGEEIASAAVDQI